MTGSAGVSGLAGLLADERRLRALAAVALGATTTAAVADAARLPRREAAAALHRLVDAGLVVEAGSGLAVAYEGLQQLARDERPAGEDATGLAPFVEGRRLRSLPAARERRWGVLAHVATHAFQTGRDYTEREVVAVLDAWCTGGEVDHAALRRYLVEEGLVSRGGGIYRLGGDAPALSPGEQAVRSLGLT